MIKFKSKVWKQGNSLLITIPAWLYKGVNKTEDIKENDIVEVTILKGGGYETESRESA